MRSAVALLLVFAGLVVGTLWFNYHRAESLSPAPLEGSYTVEMNVMSGEGHQKFIQMPQTIKLQFVLYRYAVDPPSFGAEFSGPPPFVAVDTDPPLYTITKGVLDTTWGFLMSGRGTVAGFENILVTFSGHFEDNGALTGVYTMGANNELPGGYPIEYRVKNSTLATYTPTPTDTPTVTATPTSTPDYCIIAGGAGGSCTPTATPAPGGNGDCNHDGVANPIDALLSLQYGAGLLPNPGSCGDVNRDGVVNALDAALVLQYAAGLIAHLPWP